MVTTIAQLQVQREVHWVTTSSNIWRPAVGNSNNRQPIRVEILRLLMVVAHRRLLSAKPNFQGL